MHKLHDVPWSVFILRLILTAILIFITQLNWRDNQRDRAELRAVRSLRILSLSDVELPSHEYPISSKLSATHRGLYANGNIYCYKNSSSQSSDKQRSWYCVIRKGNDYSLYWQDCQVVYSERSFLVASRMEGQSVLCLCSWDYLSNSKFWEEIMRLLSLYTEV